MKKVYTEPFDFSYTQGKHGRSGFTLVETLLVVFVAGLLIFLMANLPNAFNLISKSKNASLAREIAIKQIEDKRSIGFDNLALGTETISDTRIALLPQAAGSLSVEDCPVEICTNNEQIKLVSVLVTWKENNKEQKVELRTLIGLGGLN